MTCEVDDISSFFVKDCWQILSKPLYILFNPVIRTFAYQRIYKNSLICPIHKSGNTSHKSSYRLISIMPNFAKVSEIIFYSQVKQFTTISQHHLKQWVS